MIELNHVSKMYGNVVGVNDLTLEIPTGAFGLIGPNGSGKTTLINLLIGHFRPTLGTLRVFDCDPASDRRLLRRIGLCPASDVLYPNVSAIEWVTYQVRLHGIARTESRSLAETALETVGMTDAMHRPMGTYSLGMRQRTKIAQAIAHDPDLLILDEPYNGLDPVGRNDMTRLLKEWTDNGRGLIFASHVLQEIESVTSSFLLIHGGRLLASGTADEIESLLAETPQEICLVGNDVAKLIHRFADVDWVDAMDWNQTKDELRVSLREPMEFYDRIATWIRDDRLTISQLRTPNGNLEAVFESLLRRHRGEAP
ncbi:putative ABC transporter ATP-binding protein YxlF [Rubripirellula amarantea]|uniref:Putative ABC transporter ATP-binding protein YxlF n=1 Tax=Rubripirellula amarantea TaxID=2527999 RepID=A0A5C5WKB2_9BACT|nr:ABC transporter ATP-binding protein [Rubripirellula amarantea]TWT50451.1 putative ABC transporter ATP-binding protein YxlF [Rubripirellula amarantea]